MTGPVAEGLRIVKMDVSPENLRDRTLKLARQMLSSSGFSVADVRGAVVIMCGPGFLLGGSDSVQECSETLSSAVGCAPAIGLCVDGEQGRQANGASSHGFCTFGTVVFTNKRVEQ